MQIILCILNYITCIKINVCMLKKVSLENVNVSLTILVACFLLKIYLLWEWTVIL